MRLLLDVAAALSGAAGFVSGLKSNSASPSSSSSPGAGMTPGKDIVVSMVRFRSSRICLQTNGAKVCASVTRPQLTLCCSRSCSEAASGEGDETTALQVHTFCALQQRVATLQRVGREKSGLARRNELVSIGANASLRCLSLVCGFAAADLVAL